MFVHYMLSVCIMYSYATCVWPEFIFNKVLLCSVHPMYHHDSEFSDRYVWVNRVNPDRRSLIRVYTVCHSVCILLSHYSI